MTNPIPRYLIDEAVARYGLSERAGQNSLHDLPWDMVEKIMGNLWTSENPNGLVFLGVAENPLLHKEVASYITNNLAICPSDHLSYGVGPRGSPHLKKALTTFLNTDFRAHEPILEKEILIAPGAVAAIDALAWSICNENEGIIVPMPFYTGFKPAVGERARAQLVPASFQSIEGYINLDDIFDPEMNRKALENALEKAAQEGVQVRAVLLSNPHNPLGRCYPAETLKEIARFCGRNNLHLISDEIFAMSVYDNPRTTNVHSFVSVLELDLQECLGRHLVHIVYGMGKDFGATGLRLGLLHSRNEGLIAAVSSICIFGWVPYITQQMWVTMLEDKAFLATFLAKNRRILTDHSEILITFLEDHNIPYYGDINAGVFVWVDLRRYLCNQSSQEGLPILSIPQLSPSEVQLYRSKEMDLFKRCLEGGVGISLGSSFSTEELGWFRISFTVEKDALRVGLQRLLTCLQAIENEVLKKH